MNRTGHNNVDFFVGKEVEKTPAFGAQTLFVVGLQQIDTIQERITKYAKGEYPKSIQHIFFGADHSFHPPLFSEWLRWSNMIQHFLDQGVLCSLDIPITHAEKFHDTALCEYDNFIPQIRISLPHVGLWNYNTMVKIDDSDFDASNPGVWCHSLHDLQDRSKFTSWDQYTKDEIV